MKKTKFLTLACVTAITLTTACLACACGNNSSHDKNDVYYRERISGNSSEPIAPPDFTDPSDSQNRIKVQPMPAPYPHFPRFPHRRPEFPAPPYSPLPPAEDSSSDSSCDSSSTDSSEDSSVNFSAEE